MSDTGYLSENGQDKADCGRNAQTPCRTFRTLWNQFGQAPLPPGDNTVSGRFQVRSLDILSDTDIEIEGMHLTPRSNNLDAYYVKFVSIENKIIHINIFNTTIEGIYLIFNSTKTSLLIQNCQFHGSGIRISSETAQQDDSVILKNCSFSGDVMKSVVQVTNINDVSIDTCTFSNLKNLELNSAFECLNSSIRIMDSSFEKYTVSYNAFLVLNHCNMTASNLEVSRIRAFSVSSYLHVIMAHWSRLRIEDSKFAYNYLSQGCVLRATESHLIVSNSTFHSNSVRTIGMVSIVESKGIFKNCKFVNSAASKNVLSYGKEYEGTIVNTKLANLTIDECIFHHNAFYMPVHTQDNTHGVINNSYFFVNHGAQEDIVRVVQGKLKIANSYFGDSTNIHTVIACYHGDISLENVIVSKNQPVTLRMSDCTGHIESSQFIVTVFSLTLSHVTIVNSSWLHDRPLNTAMMWITTSNINITRSNFSPLNIGEKLGSIFELKDSNKPTYPATTLLVYSSSFKDNNAEQNGGILNSKIRGKTKGFALFSDCIFVNNTAENGGIVWSHYMEVVFENCIIEGNSALETGGILYSTEESEITLNNCTVTNNKAGQDGGVVSISSDSLLSLRDTILENNTCNGEGGVVKASWNITINIHNSSFASNKALASRGGAFVMENYCALNTEVSKFEENKAGTEGGAIVVLDHSLYSDTGSSFIGNMASDIGKILMYSI